MSKVRNTSKLTADGGVTPGSYILAKLNLTASNETVVDIKELVTRIVISESKFSINENKIRPIIVCSERIF